MKKDRLFIAGTLVLALWTGMTYFLFVHRPNNTGHSLSKSDQGALSQVRERVQELEQGLKGQRKSNEVGKTFFALRLF